ncbi:MAG TPA: DNA primase [Thermoanaerobaculia bacterium]
MAFVDLNDSIISNVRSSADIVEFVNQVTPLKLAGKSYKGLCPFHREKSPSFHVDRDKGLFYCFGCGTGGDIFKFLVLTERFTFPEAVEHVANRVGIELPKKKRTSREADKDDLLEVLDAASSAFFEALHHFPNNAAVRYLQERNVPKEVVQKYGFGFAPEGWDYVLRRLSEKHGEKKLELAGLVQPRKEGKSGFYDRFRNRLMIPIHSESGTIVGFGGRSLDGSEPKYLNSPESEVFNKSRLLYNLHRSKDAMRRIDRAILVEGYFDAIAVDYAGVPGVIASMGTSLTSGQATLLRRFTRRVVLAYDGDNAGRQATLRAAQVLLAAGVHVDALDLQGEKDPDSLIQNHGVDRFLEVLGNASDIFQFALREWAAGGAAMTGREKSERVELFVPLLNAVTDPVIRNDAAQRVADAFRLSFDAIWSKVRGKAQQTGVLERQPVAPQFSAEKFFLTAALQGKLEGETLDRIQAEFFEEPACKTLFSLIKSELESGKAIDFAQITTQVKGEAEVTLLSEVSLADDLDDTTLQQKIHENLIPMQRSYIDRRTRQIQRELVEALQNNDDNAANKLWIEKRDLLRMSNTLK